MSTKITSPLEGFDGTTVFGPLSVEFKDGVAETDEKITPALRSYLETRGYKIGKPAGDQPKQATPTPTVKAAEQKGGQKNG